MKPELWNRAKQILPEVRELPLEDRAAFLDEACADDAELRREVESFLATDPAALAFMEQPPIRLLEEEATAIREDSQVGAYRILRRLGSGGMGIVYLATRVGDEFKREVALKVLLAGQAGQASEEAEQRFLQEMGILAKLNHPNIAKLHEGGRTEDGRLYYLMEYVEGQPIDVYCRERKLSLEERLRLFQKVCAAVQYAHTQLVVHRDLKPSNVLVNLDGEPKLLDFGVAKPLEGAGIGAAVLTGVNQKLFTPDYASPEQITSSTISTASDVYSLGVMLYELLVGDRPHRLGELSETEIWRIVCDEIPAPPSTALLQALSDATQGDSPTTDPATATFRRRLRGDLDTIVLMALRKQSNERYSTVQKFTDDVERYLDGRPIKARKPSLGYKVRKFLKRNRAATSIAGLIFAIVGAAIWGQVNQYQKTERQRDRATAVANFLEDLFEAPDPYQGNQGDLPISTILEKGVERLRNESKLDTNIKAALLGTLGNVYLNLGYPGDAEPLLHESLRLAEQETPRDVERRIEALSSLVDLFISQREDDKAEATVLKALKLKREPELISQLGRVLRQQNHLEEAQAAFQEASDRLKRKYGKDSYEYASNLANLGALLLSRGEYKQAENHYREAREIFEHLYGEKHLYVARLTHNLAATLERQERYREAGNLYAIAIDQKVAATDAEHPIVAASLNSLAVVNLVLGKYNEARPLYERAIQILSARFGDEHPDVAMYLNNLAELHRVQGHFEQAENLFLQSLALRKARLGEDHLEVATNLSNLALLYLDIGEIKKAREYFNSADLIFKDRLPEDHPSFSTLQRNRCLILTEEGKPEEALALLIELLESETARGRENKLSNVRIYHTTAVANLELGNIEAARNAIEKGLSVLQSYELQEHWWFADLESLRGEVLRRLGRDDDALLVLQSSYEKIRSIRGDDSMATRKAKSRFAAATAVDDGEHHRPE